MTKEPQLDSELGRLRKTLESAVPPVAPSEPRRDLWPLLLRRIAATPTRRSLRMPWFDWALLGLAATALLLFPALLPALLYHL
jgi:hypothetical protein